MHVQLRERIVYPATLLFGLLASAITTEAGEYTPPGLTVHDNELIAVVDDSESIFLRRYDGKNWTRIDRLNGSRTRSTPRPFTFDGRLRMVYRANDRSGHIYIKTRTGSGWKRAGKLASTTTKSPSPVVNDGKLYIFFRSRDRSGQIYIKRRNSDGSWDKAKKLPSTTSQAPTVVSLRPGTMLMAFKGKGNANVYVNQSDGYDDWGTARKLDFETRTTPMLIKHGRDVLMIYNKPRGRSVAIRSRAEGWQKERLIRGLDSENGPTGVSYRGELYIGTNPDGGDCYRISKVELTSSSASATTSFESCVEGGDRPPTPPLPQTECSIGGCPEGTHPSEFTYSGDCNGDPRYDNATICAPNTGFVFTMCGIGDCPVGYETHEATFTLKCSLGDSILNNAQICQKTD